MFQGRAWSWVIKFCLDIIVQKLNNLPATSHQSHYSDILGLLNCFQKGIWYPADIRYRNMKIPGCVGAASLTAPTAPALQLFWGATTCPHSAGNEKELEISGGKYNSQHHRRLTKFTIKSYFNSSNIQNLSLPYQSRNFSFFSFTWLVSKKSYWFITSSTLRLTYQSNLSIPHCALPHNTTI